LLAQDLNKAETARRLGIVPKTIDYHIANLLPKLGFKSFKEAVGWFNTYLADVVEDAP